MSSAAGVITGSAAPRRPWSFLPVAITGCLLVVALSEWALLSMRIGRLESSSHNLDKIVSEIFHQQRAVNDAAAQQSKQAQLQVDAVEQQSKQAQLKIDVVAQQSQEGRDELGQLKQAQQSMLERLTSSEKTQKELAQLIDSLKIEIRKVADAAADQALAKTVETLRQDMVRMAQGVALNKDELRRLGKSHDQMHSRMAWHVANLTASPAAVRAAATVEARGALASKDAGKAGAGATASPVESREAGRAEAAAVASPVESRVAGKAEAAAAASPVANGGVAKADAVTAFNPVASGDVAKAEAGGKQVPGVVAPGKELGKDYEQLEELLKEVEVGQQQYEDYTEGELLLDVAEEQQGAGQGTEDEDGGTKSYGAYEDLEADDEEGGGEGLEAADQATGPGGGGNGAGSQAAGASSKPESSHKGSWRQADAAGRGPG